MHLIGVQGMPRRVADYSDQFADWNLAISISSWILGLASLIFVYNMVASVARRPARAGEPVARADARVAGLLASADLQLRLHPHGRRRAVRVRRARRGAWRVHASLRCRPPRPARTRRASRGPRADDPRRRQRDDRRSAADRRGARARRGPPRRARGGVRARARAPGTATSSTTTPSTTRHRCASTWRAGSCASTGIDAIGEVGDPDPYTATMDAVAEFAPDEIIVSTYPQVSSGWLRRDLIERITDASGLPVHHVVVDLDGEAPSVPGHPGRGQPHHAQRRADPGAEGEGDRPAPPVHRRRPPRGRRTASRRRRHAAGWASCSSAGARTAC